MKKITAFSILELTISLIVISFVTAAFAPIITKHVTSKSIGLSSSDVTTTECSHIDKDGDCLRCTKKACVTCDKDCKDNEYVDIEKCKCVSCARIFGDDCTKCSRKKCKECKAGKTVDSKKETGKSACATCKDNTYSNITTVGKCEKCEDGKQVNADHTGCRLCDPGHYCKNGEVKDCQKGNYCPEGSSEQLKCEKGTYQDSTNQVACKPCLDGN